ncbi:hypothetical protein M422DRAFT_264228 [Sphaerobolus stellatus SS14]|uniref:Aminoglycoside phosphotransferase domain-containing protein n=1 Tax=Sphaerobolus stellatus (strain SS14) TaxID=990650 RepID=A0A0C9V8J7_SPHS4|nr:hypothetical protein M422DRAFT_264228 [Sphaerobolus stellatus SS14]
MSTDNDTSSNFSYDGEAEPDTFSLSQLKAVVNRHFGESCELEKLDEGGYHKVYNVLRSNGSPLDAVVRVAAPAFPTDKLESEVSTYKYLAAHTKIPVPQIYAWNSDASNPVGAEYMIMQKVPGVSSSQVWQDLPEEVKKNAISQVAQYLLEIFSLRFATCGSIYWTPQNGFHVGPIVNTPFYRALDGFVRIPGDVKPHNPNPHRGPFSTATDYLLSFAKAEIAFLSENRSLAVSELGNDSTSGEQRLEQGERDISTPESPFSFKLDDFRLSNIMINEETGQVTGLIDFEGTTITPLWECAVIPRWLQPPDDPESSYEGGPAESRIALRAQFLDTVDKSNLGGEWRKAYELGRPFRELPSRLRYQVNVWASDSLEEWVDERLEWAKAHPRVRFPETDI